MATISLFLRALPDHANPTTLSSNAGTGDRAHKPLPTSLVRTRENRKGSEGRRLLPHRRLPGFNLKPGLGITHQGDALAIRPNPDSTCTQGTLT